MLQGKKSILLHLQLALVFILFSVCARAQINVTNSTNATTLVQKLVGKGVTFSNATLTCATNGAGFFSSTSATVNMDSGVVLTTGYAKDASGIVGVNNPASLFASEDRGFNSGDADLFNLAYAYNNTLNSGDVNDVCILKFDFVPIGDTIKFNYKFASEEYPDYVCSNFNDAFAFFITGTPGYSIATNLAKIPGTNIPVTINSVNSGTPGSGYTLSNCTNMGSGSPFSTYYQNLSSNSTIVYDGGTIKMQAKAVVTPCSTYAMKFVIADIKDHEYDSGVFLEANSFTSEGIEFSTVKPSVVIPANWPFITEGCRRDTITIKRKNIKNTPQSVFVTVGGTATNGTDYTTIPATLTIPANDSIVKLVINPLVDAFTEGVETITIGIKALACQPNFSDTITIRIKDYPKYTVIDDDSICLGQSKALLATQITADTALKFKWNPGNVNGASYLVTPLSTSVFTLTASYIGCPPRDSTVKITVAPFPTIIASNDTSICAGNTIPLIATVTNVSIYPATYSWSPSATVFNPTILSTSATPISNTTYTITATNIVGCTKTEPVVVTLLPTLNLSSNITSASCNTANGAITVINNFPLTGINYN